MAPLLASGQWSISDHSPAQSPESPFIRESKTVSRPGETGFFSTKRIELIWFKGADFAFKVIDNGPSGSPTYSGLASAMAANDCKVGCNGGFFLKDHSPSGLMIAGGEATGKFGEGGLLSGIVLTSGKGNPYVLRRGEYDATKYKASDLLQSGPFLVDQSEKVRGLSGKDSSRRTFVLHDGGNWFALGYSDPLTLDELGGILAQTDFSPSRRIHRALNLDGGSSSGIYFFQGAEAGALRIEPIKTVRNFIGIFPR